MIDGDGHERALLLWPFTIGQAVTAIHGAPAPLRDRQPEAVNRSRAVDPKNRAQALRSFPLLYLADRREGSSGTVIANSRRGWFVTIGHRSRTWLRTRFERGASSSERTGHPAAR